MPDQNNTQGYNKPLDPNQDPAQNPFQNPAGQDYNYYQNQPLNSNPYPESPQQPQPQQPYFGDNVYAPNTGYDQNYDQTPYNQDFNQTPANPNPYYDNQGAVDPNQTLAQDYTQDYTQNFDPAAAPSNNTFEEKKSGNKIFLYGSIAIIVVLLIATGVLVYLSFFSGNQPTLPANTDQSQTGQPNPAPTDNNQGGDDQNGDPQDQDNPNGQTGTPNTTLTGGPDTPATKGREYNATTLPKPWILQRFTSSDRDAQGTCTNQNRCGDSSDPDDDGLTNLEEYNFQTDPLVADTDRDQIADGDEAFVYFTDPSLRDSDNDTFADGVEITGCFDPTSTATAKMNTARLAKIAENTSLRSLNEPTISLLRTNGATPADISGKGVVASKCPAPSGSSTSTGNNTGTNSNTGSTGSSTPSNNSSTGSTGTQPNNQNPSGGSVSL